MAISNTTPIPAGPAWHHLRLDLPVRGARLVTHASELLTTGEDQQQALLQQARAEAASRMAEEVAAIRQSTEQSLRAIENAVEDIAAQRRTALEELQQVAIEMSVAIASHVVHESIDAGTWGIDRLVAEAVSRFADSNPLVIALHPSDLARIQPETRSHDASTTLSLVADDSLAPGDCEVRGLNFNYLARMETVLSEIRVELLESLENAQTERRRTAAANSPLRRFPDRRETA